MNYDGLIIGLSTFILIGVFHPIVIKSEYYWGTKIWPLFLLAGLGLCGLSIFITNGLLSIVFGVAGFSSLWSIFELFHQKKRVDKGWYPKNPKRNGE